MIILLKNVNHLVFPFIILGSSFISVDIVRIQNIVIEIEEFPVPPFSLLLSSFSLSLSFPLFFLFPSSLSPLLPLLTLSLGLRL